MVDSGVVSLRSGAEFARLEHAGTGLGKSTALKDQRKSQVEHGVTRGLTATMNT